MTPQPVPPTPTFLPPGTPFFSMPNSMSLWGAAPTMIQSWNMIPGQGRTVIQAVVLIALIITFAFVLLRFARDFTGRSEE